MTKEALSVNEFCEAHGICRATLYNLWRDGKGPRFFHAGRRRLITPEAAAEWRHKMETEAASMHAPEAA